MGNLVVGLVGMIVGTVLLTYQRVCAVGIPKPSRRTCRS